MHGSRNVLWDSPPPPPPPPPRCPTINTTLATPLNSCYLVSIRHLSVVCDLCQNAISVLVIHMHDIVDIVLHAQLGGVGVLYAGCW